MSREDEILNFMGREDISLLLPFYSKYRVTMKTEHEVAGIVGTETLNHLNHQPQLTKIYFYKDYYVFYEEINQPRVYGIGKDPDMNNFFKPYEE